MPTFHQEGTGHKHSSHWSCNETEKADLIYIDAFVRSKPPTGALTKAVHSEFEKLHPSAAGYRGVAGVIGNAKRNRQALSQGKYQQIPEETFDRAQQLGKADAQITRHEWTVRDDSKRPQSAGPRSSWSVADLKAYTQMRGGSHHGILEKTALLDAADQVSGDVAAAAAMAATAAAAKARAAVAAAAAAADASRIPDVEDIVCRVVCDGRPLPTVDCDGASWVGAQCGKTFEVLVENCGEHAHNVVLSLDGVRAESGARLFPRGQETQASRELIGTVKELQQVYPAVYGRIIDLCKPSHKKYNTAVSVAISSGLRHGIDRVIVQTQAVARQCSQYLSERRLPSVTFVALDSIEVEPIDETARRLDGSCKLVLDVMVYDQAYEKAMRYAVGNSIVVDTVSEARRASCTHPKKVTEVTVTLDGTEVRGDGRTHVSEWARRRFKVNNSLDVKIFRGFWERNDGMWTLSAFRFKPAATQDVSVNTWTAANRDLSTNMGKIVIDLRRKVIKTVTAADVTLAAARQSSHQGSSSGPTPSTAKHTASGAVVTIPEDLAFKRGFKAQIEHGEILTSRRSAAPAGQRALPIVGSAAFEYIHDARGQRLPRRQVLINYRDEAWLKRNGLFAAPDSAGSSEAGPQGGVVTPPRPGAVGAQPTGVGRRRKRQDEHGPEAAEVAEVAATGVVAAGLETPANTGNVWTCDLTTDDTEVWVADAAKRPRSWTDDDCVDLSSETPKE
jgi:hypothetical protein